MNPVRIRTYFLAAVMLLLPMLSGAQNISKQQSEKARLEKEIRILNKQIADNSAQAGNLTAKLNLTRKQIEGRKKLVASYDREIASLKKEISAAGREVSALQARLDTLSAHYSRLVKGVYKNRNPKVWYMYILASENISQGFRRYNYFRNLSDNLRAQGQAVIEAKTLLAEKQSHLNGLLSDAEKAKNARKKELAALENDAKSITETTAKLKKQRKKLEADAAAKRKQAANLDNEIKALVAAATKASSKAGGKASAPSQKIVVDPTLGSSFAKNKGKLPWPVDGPVTEKFGQTFHPVFTNVKIRENKGVNIACDPDTQVQCIFEGTIIKVFTLAGYNKCILVQHGEFFTLYSKMKTVFVTAGDKVGTGKKIGIVDTLEGTTEIHFELWKGQTPQNPELWLRQ
ncbi:MAG: peptidoglycan DD-metalloendopeptidase family protein [Bacteroidales bacterium]|nr:peptidoglycan DD-metalloendopeptidase family protein [Bacteroidales bacterium]